MKIDRVAQLFIVLALVFSVATSKAQQPQAVETLGPPVHTVFWTQPSIGLVASCEGSACTALTSLFCQTASNVSSSCSGPDPSQESVVCPLPAGGRCVFHIALETSTQLAGLSSGAKTGVVNGLYRYLVDGVAPTPGPTPNLNGYSVWGNSGEYTSNYMSVVAVVTNAKRNQAHTIEIDDVCVNSSDATGCEVVSFRALARIDAFVASPPFSR